AGLPGAVPRLAGGWTRQPARRRDRPGLLPSHGGYDHSSTGFAEHSPTPAGYSCVATDAAMAHRVGRSYRAGSEKRPRSKPEVGSVTLPAHGRHPENGAARGTRESTLAMTDAQR